MTNNPLVRISCHTGLPLILRPKRRIYNYK